MSKRIRYKSRQAVRFKMRTILLLTSVVGGMMLSSLLLVFQLFENEDSLASSDPMVVSRIEVFQDTTPVLKGTSMQIALGIRIHTKGKAQHLNFSGLEIAARGTTKPVGSYVSNARLWSTGSKDFFIPVEQLGATLPVIGEENFRLDGKQTLKEGDNYFWITFDVNKMAGSKATCIDAECISVQIGTLRHEPDISAPPGSRRIKNNLPYYSSGNGDISSLNSWNTARDGSGSRPANFSQSNATFHIQSGHILRNDLNACLTYLVIERNGVLLSTSGIKSERVEIHGGGTMVQEKQALNPDNLEFFIIKNGGNFIHRNQGYIPGKIKKFEVYSNVVLNNYSSVTFSGQVAWGNLIIDAKTAKNTDFSNNLKNIRGNLEIRSTGYESFLYSTNEDTINIAGDLVINGGRLALAPLKNSMVLNVNKEFVIKSGCFTDVLPGLSTKGNLEFYPGNKVYLKSGDFKMTGKNAFIRFREEYITWNQDSATVTLPDVTVMPGCTLRLTGNSTGMLAENRNFIVSSTAMLDCGTTTLKGKGEFHLEQYGTLATAHAEGLHSDEDAGSIQTKSRYYSSGAGYIFGGKCTPQSTGIFKTAPLPNTVNQMTIRKNDPAGILILEQDIHITGRLIKVQGSINKNSYKLQSSDQITATAAP